VISVVIPTVTGREDHYERCARAYAERTDARYELITEVDHATVGLAWQAGAVKAKGDYIHLTCDDLEPLHGWDVAAVAVTTGGRQPAPKVTSAIDGSLQSRPVWGQEIPEGTDTGISVIPFLTRDMWEAVRPLFTAHYYTDDFVSERARRAGYPPAMCNAYAFRHHWAQHRRGAGMTENERMVKDQQLYWEALQRVADGQWTEPWPG
jgi:hypothetical protein